MRTDTRAYACIVDIVNDTFIYIYIHMYSIRVIYLSNCPAGLPRHRASWLRCGLCRDLRIAGVLGLVCVLEVRFVGVFKKYDAHNLFFRLHTRHILWKEI